MKRIQELLRNASLAERVFTFISLILLVSIGIVWFVGVHLNSTDQTQTIVPTTIQENVKVAEEAVAMLESSNTEDNLQHAKDAINQLSGGTVKEELQKRVDVVDKAMKKKAEEIKKAKLKAELVRAEAAKKLAEEQKNSETSDSSIVTTLDETTTGGTESYQEDTYNYQPSYNYVDAGNSSVYTPPSSSSTVESSSSSTPTEIVPPSSSEVVVPSTPTPVEPSSSTETEVPADSSMIIEDQSQR